MNCHSGQESAFREKESTPSEQESDTSGAPPDLTEFSDLVYVHQAGLRAFVRALGVESDCVDDIAQEVFVIAFHKRAQFQENKDFGRWLRGIARNLVANERRKSARRLRLLNQAASEPLHHPSRVWIGRRRDSSRRNCRRPERLRRAAA